MDWTQQYEDLRSCQFDDQRGWGLSLFMRQGMAAWMRACATEIPSAATEVPILGSKLWNVESDTSVTSEMPGELRFDITTHIVNMIQSRMEVTV